MAPKQLTQCPENLREAIDWLLQNKSEGNLPKLANAVKDLIDQAVEDARSSLISNKNENACVEVTAKDIELCELLKSRLELLHKHEKNLENFFGDKDSGINPLAAIIEKVCSGFEHLLGYDSGNYTGRGIVYSDCDRLRDAVLMYLHGVLESVKMDPSIQVYMPVSEPILVVVLNTLEFSAGKGSTRFTESIGEVTKWLSNFEKIFTALTNAAITKFDDIKLDHIEGTKGFKKALEALNGASPSKRNAVFAALQKCLKKANELESTTLKKALEAIEVLDSDIKNKVQKSVMQVETLVKAFAQSAQNTSLLEVLAKVDETLGRLPVEVERKIKNGGHETVEQFRAKMEMLHGGVNTLKDDQFNELKKSVDSGIKNYGDKVSSTMNTVSRDYKNKIIATLTTVVAKVSVLSTQLIDAQAEELEKELQNQLESLPLTALRGQFVKNETYESLLKRKKSEIQSIRSQLKSENLDEENIHQYKSKISGSISKVLDAINRTNSVWQKEIQQQLQGLHKDVQNVHTIKQQAESRLLLARLEKQIDCLERLAKMTGDGSVKDTLKTATSNVSKLNQELERTRVDAAFWLNQHRDYLKDAFQNAQQASNKLAATIKEKNSQDPAVNSTSVFTNSKIDELLKKFEDEFKGHIKDLIEKVGMKSTDNNSVHKLLDELQSHINALQHAIRSLTDHVSIVERSLQHWIGKANRDLTSAFHEAKEAITKLGQQMKTEVENALTDIIKEAKEKYGQTMSANLTELNDNLTSEIKNIKDIIYEDFNHGAKGLLRQLNSFVNGIDIIKDIKTSTYQILDAPRKSSLSLAVLIVKIGFKRFIKGVSEQRDVKSEKSKIDEVSQSLDKLLQQIYTSDHFDNDVNIMRDRFIDTLNALSAETMDDAPKRVLKPLKYGLEKFVEELNKAYVSTYSLQKWNDADKIKYAKVFCSVLEILYADLDILHSECNARGTWRDTRIRLNEQNNKENLLGYFLKKCGYRVASGHDRQDGELQNKTDCTGQSILKRLTNDKNVFNSPNNDAGNLYNLYETLYTYYNICHCKYFPDVKHPCTVKDMLIWLTGLWHHPMLDPLKDHIKEILVAPEKYKNSNYLSIPIEELKLDPTSTVTAKMIFDTLQEIGTQSHNVLTTILGYGGQSATYACDFANNALGLHYPSTGDECLHTLLDILRRLFPVLRFLQSQCGNPASDYGWFQCRYGKDIEPANWHCDDHSTTKVDCNSRSPLMSYLSDCLPGYLPHQLTSIGCDPVCTTCSTSEKGMPCLLPLGFRAFSGRTRRGSDIREILDKFFNIPNHSTLFCLVATPPATLPEHFGFVLSIVREIQSGGTPPLKTAIKSTIIDSSIGIYDELADLTSALRDTYGSEYVRHNECVHPHLITLTSSSICYGESKKIHWAPYLRSLCTDLYKHLANRNSEPYLSWVLYLPWVFRDCLKNLHDAFNHISCEDWSCLRCLDGDGCRSGQHGLVEQAEGQPARPCCQCLSAVNCEGVLPTLYKYGFTFGDVFTLKDPSTRRSCSDFSNHLRDVLDSEHFGNLFTKCDEYLFKTRGPFIWTLFALWILSLLYLLYVLLGSVDTFYIRSHWRSLSSHNIYAQSLLAASRGNKIAKLAYLQV
ncbi:Apolipophorin-III superfamily protein, putative [Babesia bigemina]|uniref:Apolipophorin-III superfamily protein, putative n=1 Tax=Babesia bigemina TaxID=5866 RepID=A0A061D7K6_BABBI|nr:Apolipophorin-III superfamily protein, putative [Babesia bigemina]CDR96681.1 Apolipophorin-III superfamily protein, putative [Babesia bigemina]|eukprot:XP_012768867.1 Apolipophorin-III superfamily protein, putative [Babesia bigemina]